MLVRPAVPRARLHDLNASAPPCTVGMASLNAPAIKRSVICPSFHRLTLRVKWAIEPFRLRIGLVVRSIRYNYPVMPSACTVNLQPLAQAGRGAGALAVQRCRQSLQLLLGQFGVAVFPGVAHGASHACMQFLRQVPDHVAPLLLLAALDQGRAPKHSTIALRRTLPPSITHTRTRSASS